MTVTLWKKVISSGFGGQRLAAHEDDVDRIAERRGEDRDAADQRVAAEVGRAPDR